MVWSGKITLHKTIDSVFSSTAWIVFISNGFPKVALKPLNSPVCLWEHPISIFFLKAMVVFFCVFWWHIHNMIIWLWSYKLASCLHLLQPIFQGHFEFALSLSPMLSSLLLHQHRSMIFYNFSKGHSSQKELLHFGMRKWRKVCLKDVSTEIISFCFNATLWRKSNYSFPLHFWRRNTGKKS